MSLKHTFREFVRGLIYRCGLQRLIHFMRRRRGNKFRLNTAESRRERFAQIYRGALWNIDGAQPLSGAGSTETAASNVATELPSILKRLQVRSLVDIGCGDFTWMQKVEMPCEYTGIDIVPSVIDANVEKFGTPRRHFQYLDAVVDPLPYGDAALCREILFHLSFEDAINLIRNIRAAKFKYLLATTDRATMFNSDIETGDFRILNLCRPPFRFQSPKFSLADDKIMAGRIVGVWQIEELPDWTLPKTSRFETSSDTRSNPL